MKRHRRQSDGEIPPFQLILLKFRNSLIKFPFAATGRLEAPQPTLPWRVAAGHRLSPRCHATGRPTRPSVATAMIFYLLLYCKRDSLSFLQSLISLCWTALARYPIGHQCTVCPLMFKQLSTNNPASMKPCEMSRFCHGCDACHPCTCARHAVATGRLEAPPPTPPWRAAAGHSVHSF